MKEMSNEKYKLLQHSQLIFYICNVLYQELSQEYDYPRITVTLLPHIGWEIRISIGNKADNTLCWVNEICNINKLEWLSTNNWLINDLVRYILNKFAVLTSNNE